MKTLFINLRIVVLIVAAMLLIYGVPGVSYAQGNAPTVTPGETNTSLKVSFPDYLYAYDENAYQIQLRHKSPQGDWITRCATIKLGGGTSWFFGFFHSSPRGNYRISVSFTDLEPGTSYEARYRDTNLSECHENPPNPDPWSAIGEGTTHLVAPPRVEFIDANLAWAIRKTLDLDTKGEHIELLKIPEANLDELTQLQYDNDSDTDEQSKISNLSGLEHATQLTILSLQENNLRDLTPLAQLTQLTALDLSDNNISDLTPLAQLIQLTTLILEDNQINNITPLAQLTQLMELSLGGFRGNEVSNILSLEQLTQLTALDLSDNNISDLTPLAQLTQLTTLNLPENNISDLTPLAQLTQLTELNLGGFNGNNISDLTPLTQLMLLRELDLSNNNITDVTPLAQLTQLRELDLSFNLITDITPLAQLINLEFLFLFYNKDLSDLTPLAQLPQRTRIHHPDGGFITSSEIELLTVSTPQPLTSISLNGSSVTLTLLPSGSSYDTSLDNIRNGLTLSGIDGVTISDVVRLSDTEIQVTLGFTGSLEETSILTFTLEPDVVNGYEGILLKSMISVDPIIGLTVSTPQPLTALSLYEFTVTLNLTNGVFEDKWDVVSNVSLSGISGIRFDYDTFRSEAINRVNDSEVTIDFTFNGNIFDIDEETKLIITVEAGAIVNYDGESLTGEIPVSPGPTIDEVEPTGELVASTAFPLTNDTLNGSVVKLTLKTKSFVGTTYDYDYGDSDPVIEMTGIPNVSLGRLASGSYLYLSNRQELWVRLFFSGDLETDETLTFIVHTNMISGYKGPPLAATLPVTVKTGKQELVSTLSRPSMYWINTQTKKIESFVTFDAVTNQVTSLAVDNVDNKIYWSEESRDGGTLKRAHLDGTDVEQLVSLAYIPESIAVDTIADKLYWFNSLQGTIHSADFNGTNINTLIRHDESIFDIAIDAENGKLYWSDLYSVSRMSLDGTNVETILSGWGTRQTKGIGGIAVADGKIYWTEHLVWYRTSGNIRRANLNGTEVEILATPLGTANDIDVDTVNGKVYWTNGFGGIQRMDINGGDIENVAYGFVAPDRFALGAVSTQPTIPTTPEKPATTDAVINISPASVESPAVGEQLELYLNITDGENVAGYQATVQFDTTALRYVSGANGDFLPAGAFFVQPKVEENLVKLNAASLAGESNGDGTLATLTFEVVAVKPSVLTLSNVLLTDSEGIGYVPNLKNAEITETQLLKGDVNGDGIVDIRDLVLVASNLGKTGQNAADVNTDGIVDIRDLVLVAGALGTSATAPSLYAKDFSMLTAAGVKQWLSQAQQLNLTDATSLQGILFLQQLLTALTPKATVLLANYPNPFNPETWIPYHLAKDANVTLHIYAVNGNLVRTLSLGHQAAGMYQNRSRAAYWDGKNALSETVTSGVYFYTLTAGDFTATRKMLILK